MGKGVDFNWLLEQAGDDQTKSDLREIERVRSLVRNKGEFPVGHGLIDLKFRDFRIQLDESTAHGSVDILTEIMKEHAHRDFPGFDGKDAQVVVDGGASEGFYTIAIKMANPACRVIAIEPNPIAFDLLKRNVAFNNFQNIELVQGAIGHSDEVREFEYANVASAVGSFHILREQRPWLPERHIESIKVKCHTLDSLYRQYHLESVDILKLDIEGAELEALSNGIDALSKTKKVVVECHSDFLRSSVVDLLTSSGFKVAYEETSEYGDVYFIR
jgi:FkbM family methyltransferase